MAKVAVNCLYLSTHQHKAAGRKTMLDIQNYGCNGNLLCYHGVVERNRIFSIFIRPIITTMQRLTRRVSVIKMTDWKLYELMELVGAWTRWTDPCSPPKICLE